VACAIGQNLTHVKPIMAKKSYMTRIKNGLLHGTMGVRGHTIHVYTLYDQTLIEKNENGLRYTVKKLQEANEKRGLIINKKKYEYMIFGNN
jgi:hypothetical protein